MPWAATVQSSSDRNRSWPTVAGVPAIVLPVTLPGRKRCRVIIYARYSTDEQNAQSIQDQYLKCEQFLKNAGFADAEITHMCDEAISGRRRNRPGIDQVLNLIRANKCDLVIAEDSSRFFRKTQFTLEFYATAIDAEVRVLTASDGIDTADDKWRVMAQVKGMVGELFLHDTAARIRRSKDARWANKNAVNPLMPGYRRMPMNPGADDPKKRGPFRDERDENWTPIIVKAFHMAAQDESLWRIAEYFDAQGFPMSGRAKSPKWTEVRVRALLQHSVYKGLEYYRKTTSKALEVTGQSRQVRTPDDQVLKREMPHLAHVSESLWRKANEAIQRRRKHNSYHKGPDHPNAGCPRDRWGILSKLFYCGICQSPMHRDGAGYRCSASKKRWTRSQGSKPRCWNHSAPGPEIVHRKIGIAIVDELLKHVDFTEVIKPSVDRMLADGDGSHAARIRDLESQTDRISKIISRLTEAIETAPECGSLVNQLKMRELELERIKSERLELMESAPRAMSLPNRDQILAEIEKVKPALLKQLGREAGAILRQLVGHIEARPYKALSSERIVCRAHFTLNLVKLLPSEWQLFIERHKASPFHKELDSRVSISLIVDLFERPLYVRYSSEVLQMSESGFPLCDICKTLNISFDVAKAAKNAALLMKSSGLDDFYAPITEEPSVKPVRWRDNRKQPKQERPKDGPDVVSFDSTAGSTN